jgi:hypothetical protein
MDDVPDQAVPSVIADEASSGSKAGTAAIGLVCIAGEHRSNAMVLPRP